MSSGFPLGATSAMVLLWCKDESYASPWAKQFLAQLDLSAGKPFWDYFQKIWPIAPEGVLDRKFTIHQQALEFLRLHPEAQVVILGAGLSPSCLELKYLEKGIILYELDRDLMDAKPRLLQFLPDSIRGAFHFINTDLMDPEGVARKMKALPWREDRATLILAEGISYYLSEEALWSLFGFFRKRSAETRILLEYLLPSKSIWRPNAEMVEQGFAYIAKVCHLSFITTYDRAKVSAHAASLGGKVLRTSTMKEIESQRTGKNQLLDKDNSGWLEIAEIALHSI